MLQSAVIDPSFALALLGLDGVGRVTTHKLIERFPDYKSLLACPREQVLVRIKGAPNAEQLVSKLFDVDLIEPALQHQRVIIRNMEERGMTLLTSGHDHWPTQLDPLIRSERPVALYAFGDTSILSQTSVGIFGADGLDSASFEAAQDLAGKVIATGVSYVSAARTGFDVVLHKLAVAAKQPCVMVARSGLAKIDSEARASVAQVVKAGGVLVSSFPMAHGPFDHDDAERAKLQAALSGPVAFFGTRTGSVEAMALDWSVLAKKPVFAHLKDREKLQAGVYEHVHLLERDIDYDWVIAAARSDSEA